MTQWLQRTWYENAESAWAPLLSVIEAPYRWAVRGRNRAYDRSWLQAARIPGCRVVSVGNLTVGGSGKTPAVIHLARRAQQAGRKVAVLSRGYGRRATEEVRVQAGQLAAPELAGDEPLLIARSCPGVPVYVGADRVSLAHRARDEGAELLLLDDGMQHRRLHRDLDIVVVDGSVGFGNGHVLPRGPLREPLEGLSRAGLVWLREGSRIGPSAFLVPVVRVAHRTTSLRASGGAAQPLELLQGASVVAVSGIARPDAFHRSLEARGAKIVQAFTFPDHHGFTPSELERVHAAADAHRARIVTTEKDQVRLPRDFPAWALVQEVEVREGADALDVALGL